MLCRTYSCCSLKERVEGETRGRKLIQSRAGVSRTTLFKKTKKPTLYAIVCSDIYGLCTFCTFSLVTILAHCILIIVRCAAANPNPSRSPSSFNVTSGSKKNQQIQSARLSQKLVNDEWIYFNGPS